jgi:thioredoxin
MAVKQQFTNFQDLLNSAELPLLVDFYATWCGPCQLMAGVLEQVKDRLQGQLKIVKIDTDRYPELASQHRIYALPTMVLFKAGQEVDRIEGAMTADQLVNRLQPFLS